MVISLVNMYVGRVIWKMIASANKQTSKQASKEKAWQASLDVAGMEIRWGIAMESRARVFIYKSAEKFVS